MINLLLRRKEDEVGRLTTDQWSAHSNYIREAIKHTPPPLSLPVVVSNDGDFSIKFTAIYLCGEMDGWTEEGRRGGVR